MVKIFVLDTNVLIHDPEAIFRFEENDLVIPIFVIEEIDQFKKEGTERGRNCRHFCRLLDELRMGSKQSLSKGVPLGKGLGTLKIFVPEGHEKTRREMDHGYMDRAILATAVRVKDSNKSKKTVFVTMDTNLRIRANAMGMDAQNYERAQARVETQSTIAEVQASRNQIDAIFQDGFVDASPCDQELRPNASVMLKDVSDPQHTALARYDHQKNRFVQLKTPREGVMGIRPKNREQAFALDLLLDESVTLVTLMGKAGTGKTLLALAAGLQKVTEDGKYSRMLVSRPIVPMGRDLGYLPGSIDEKLNPWMQPIFDNLEFLFGNGKKEGGVKEYVQLLESGIVEVEPLTYIRGRSLPYQYLIVDEAQNLTPHEIKTIITRAGDESKIVLTGDPDQIDNPYVDAASNGLSVVAERFSDQIIAGHVVLSKGERSELAELAANLL